MKINKIAVSKSGRFIFTATNYNKLVVYDALGNGKPIPEPFNEKIINTDCFGKIVSVKISEDN